MSYNSRAYDARVSAKITSVMVHEIHFHLGDILPADKMNYGESEDTTLKVIMHYSDPYGRDRTKVITLPSTTIL